MNAENSSLADTQTETNTQVATDAATADQTLPQRYGALEGENAELVAQAVDWVTQQSSDQAQRVPLLLDIAQRLSADPAAASALVLYLGVSSTDSDSTGAETAVERQQAALEAFPENVRELLNSLIQLRTYEAQVEASTGLHAERLRRLLLALAKDLRVVLMALCWQLFCLREAISAEREEQQRLAEETFQIHAPLANRLGVWQLKWELEDLAFRFRDPEQYHQVAKLVAERRTDREEFIKGFLDKLRQALVDAGIKGDVSGRPKHIYSIWRKMQRKGLDFHELFDVRAVRVQVEEVQDCYTVMGLCHMHWQPVPGEFDDYITNPKGNGYQSLHTAVVGPEGKAVEVQIRTFAMHEHAELGVAAHWRYKEGGPVDHSFDRKIQTMRQLLDSQEDALDDHSLLDSFNSLASEDRVYVLTPKGEVVDMVAGSTVLDFAYHVHSSLGNRCRGAKVNGRIVTLNYKVATGERIEVLAAKEERPSRDWLNPKLSYLKSARSRNKVRQWFKQVEREQNLQGGKQILDAELHRMDLEQVSLENVAGRFNFKSVDDLYVAVGVGDVTTGQVTQALLRELGESDHPRGLQVRKRDAIPQKQRQGDAIHIEGVGNLLHHIAKCCQPVPGDPIVGFITQGRGVNIHRADCSNMLRLREEGSPRLLEVDWGHGQRQHYPVDVSISAYDRKQLQKDISAVLSNEQVSIMAMQVHETGTGLQDIRLTLRIQDYDQLSTLLARISGLPNVLDARRVH